MTRRLRPPARRALLRRVLLCAGLLAGGPAAATVPARDAGGQAAPRFPEAGGPVQPDRRLSLQLAGGRRVTLESVRFPPTPGRSEAVNTTWCGLTIADGGSTEQLVAIGEGESEAVSCDGLAEAGEMPPGPGGVLRLGLLYQTESPNARGVTPVVLVQDAAARRWSVDDALTRRVSEASGRPTLGAMRAALRR